MKDRLYIRSLWVLQLSCDLAAVASAYGVTLALRFWGDAGPHLFDAINQILRIDRQGALGQDYFAFYLRSAPRIIFFLSALLCFLYACHDLYAGRRFLRKRSEAGKIIVSNAMVLLIIYGYWYLQRNTYHPRSLFATLLILNIVFCTGYRAALQSLLRALRRRGLDRCPAVLVGKGREADFLVRLIEAEHPHGIHITTRLPADAEELPLQRILDAVRDDQARMLICAASELDIASIMRLLEAAERHDVIVKVLSRRMGILTYEAQLPVDVIQGVPLVHFSPYRKRDWPLAMKRFASLLTAVALLILLAPLMAVIAVLVRLTSPGPLLFRQERIGFNRQPFTIFKFRTMRDRAAEEQAELERLNESGEGLFKMRGDPRVTPIGRWLRRFSLDELPQLYNVLRGDMMLVGPRPLPRRDFEKYYEEWHYSRHGGLPGITCLWQVSGRSDVDFHNMCLLDVYYLRNQTWLLDLKILLRTTTVVLFGRGAY